MHWLDLLHLEILEEEKLPVLDVKDLNKGKNKKDKQDNKEIIRNKKSPYIRIYSVKGKK
jgi:hypothetical protein